MPGACTLADPLYATPLPNIKPTPTHSLLRCEEGVGARRSEGMPDCSSSSSPLLRLMRPVRHTSITPNLLSTRCMATVCRSMWQQGVATSGSREEYMRQHGCGVRHGFAATTNSLKYLWLKYGSGTHTYTHMHVHTFTPAPFQGHQTRRV